jgi:MFS family permease
MSNTIRWSYVVGAFLLLFTLGLLDNVRGPAYPDLLHRFSIDEGEGALFYFWASLCGVLVSATGGYWLPRLGLKRSSRATLALQFVGFAGIGWVWGYQLSLNALFIFTGIFGLSVGAAGILCNLLIYEGVPRSHTRRFLSGLHSCYGVASLLAPTLIILLRQHHWMWPSIFIVFACVSLVVGLQSWFWPKENKIFEVDKPSESILKDTKVWVLGGAVAFCVAPEMLISTRLVLYYQSVVELDSSHSTFMLSLFFASLLIGRLGFSLINISIPSLRLLFLSLLGSLLCLFVGLRFIPLVLALTGLPLSIFFPSAMAMVSDWYPVRAQALVALVMGMVGVVVVVCHWLMGSLSVLWGMQIAFWLCPFLLFLSLILVVGMGFLERNHTKELH